MSQLPAQAYWLGLHLLPHFGTARLSRLLGFFDSAEALWQANEKQLLRLELPPALVQRFCRARDRIDLAKEMDKVAQAGARLISVDDSSYPQLLRNLPNRPLLLYLRGNLPADDGKALAIVGTRKASRYGKEVAQELARDLAQQGITIVSGLAQGIDTAAHRGALAVGGKTIAVVATGIDRVYPRVNEELAGEIAAKGAIISEMPLGAAPLGKNFPQRNRIISGLCLGVLVAEAPMRSGALNTVSHASEQGRDVFAVPHNIYSASGRGCNRLIQDGAKLVSKVDDILDELDIRHISATTSIQASDIQPDNDLERAVFEQLSADPLHVDFIVRQLQQPAADINGALTMLELKGLAEVAGPMQYCRARTAPG